MIEYKKETKTVEKEIPVAIICDKCGVRYEYEDDNMKSKFEAQEFHHICFEGGYGSIFGDGEIVDIDLCQHCLKEILEHYDLWQPPPQEEIRDLNLDPKEEEKLWETFDKKVKKIKKKGLLK